MPTDQPTSAEERLDILLNDLKRGSVVYRFEIEAAREAFEEMRRELAELKQTRAFFASVIKSGEPWTAICEEHMMTMAEARLRGEG